MCKPLPVGDSIRQVGVDRFHNLGVGPITRRSLALYAIAASTHDFTRTEPSPFRYASTGIRAISVSIMPVPYTAVRSAMLRKGDSPEIAATLSWCRSLPSSMYGALAVRFTSLIHSEQRQMLNRVRLNIRVSKLASVVLGKVRASQEY